MKTLANEQPRGKPRGIERQNKTRNHFHLIGESDSSRGKPRGIKPGEAIKHVIEEFLQTRRSQQTRRAYRSDLNQFFKTAEIGKLADLATIPFFELVGSINDYLENSKRISLAEDKRVLNPATVNRKAYCLSSFFQHLVNVYHYAKNPLKGYQTLKTRKKSSTQSLTRGEILDLLKFVKGEHKETEKSFRDFLIMIFLFNLALRCNEVSKLKWSDIDHSKRSIDVFQKGGTYKTLPIPPTLCDLLREFKELHRTDSYPYIFIPTCNNVSKELLKPLSTSQIAKIVELIGAKVIPDKPITPHSLRKTFIELCLDDKTDFISILNATGHSHTDMIRYYDGRDNLKNNAVHSMGNMI